MFYNLDFHNKLKKFTGINVDDSKKVNYDEITIL